MPYLILILMGCIISISALAKNADSSEHVLMTAVDVQSALSSNITISNPTNQTIVSSGLFIASYDVNDCSVCNGNILAGDNVGGVMASFVTFKPRQTVALGQNYLYNMLYNGMFYLRSNISTPCLLPGCSWPGDDPTVKWCITINAMSPDSSYTFSNYTNGSSLPAKVPAYGNPGNSNPLSYKFDLIDPATLGTGQACLGPITCDDKTLTCTVASTQNEVIHPY